MIAFITFKSSLVPLFEGLWSSNSWEFELSGFRRNRTDDLGIDSPTKHQVLSNNIWVFGYIFGIDCVWSLQIHIFNHDFIAANISRFCSILGIFGSFAAFSVFLLPSFWGTWWHQKTKDSSRNHCGLVAMAFRGVHQRSEGGRSNEWHRRTRAVVRSALLLWSGGLTARPLGHECVAEDFSDSV